ncbi:hypothetical protein M0657_004924 [Pyricularia oryzae]|uniref:Uncharacterized protein n=1 Tax=Pyricularia oryzae (strain P131) TaxID=1143193 RepID=L7JF22_PYRO1|nr:hypothetical protein M9X92_004438 [Pyricularia oryzae]KAI7923914.1 hypothetical protein M0657_004924 [Pyricularia oryzae]
MLPVIRGPAGSGCGIAAMETPRWRQSRPVKCPRGPAGQRCIQIAGAAIFRGYRGAL